MGWVVRSPTQEKPWRNADGDDSGPSRGLCELPLQKIGMEAVGRQDGLAQENGNSRGVCCVFENLEDPRARCPQ